MMSFFIKHLLIMMSKTKKYGYLDKIVRFSDRKTSGSSRINNLRQKTVKIEVLKDMFNFTPEIWIIFYNFQVVAMRRPHHEVTFGPTNRTQY